MTAPRQCRIKNFDNAETGFTHCQLHDSAVGCVVIFVIPFGWAVTGSRTA